MSCSSLSMALETVRYFKCFSSWLLWRRGVYPGFVSSDPTQVCKLHKALYGLKQAPRVWYSTFSAFLLSQGFFNSKCDSSLFIQRTATTLTSLLVYIDDILLTGNNFSHLQCLITKMHQVFSMKELGDISYFLGISIKGTPNSGYFFCFNKNMLKIFLLSLVCLIANFVSLLWLSNLLLFLILMNLVQIPLCIAV